jgi:hypothetical protein
MKSKPGQKFEKEEGDGTIDMNDFFNTGEDEDLVCSHFFDFNEETGTVTFEGEWTDDDDKSLEGSRPNLYDIEERLNAFTEFFDIEWQDESKILDNNDNFGVQEIKF